MYRDMSKDDVIVVLNHFKLDRSIFAKSGIRICWQNRGRGRAQRGPRPQA